MQYRAWLVDFDGTLYHPKPVKWAMAGELLLGGWSALRTLRRFRHSHEQLRQGELVHHAALSDAGPSPFEQQLAVTAADLGRPVTEIEQTVKSWMMERPKKWIRLFRRRSLLREVYEFQAQGGLLALVSDYPLRTKLGALHGLANAPNFDVVIASGEAGGPTTLKPSPAGYLAAAIALNVPAAACLVVGDREDADGQAARAAGMGFRHIR